ncbi:MAG: molybdate ABC transporter substrate-binding protein [Opitutales bacterium]|nr:molybdate ABC transporter substrate-binding protein [Opitutales bacterium]
MSFLTLGCGKGTKDSASPVAANAVTVAAAADLQFALPEILALFHQEHPEFQVRVTYGSSGNMRAQIAQRAPFDLFLSADIEFPKRLIESGHGVADSLFPYAVGRLVLYVLNDSPLDPERTMEQTLLDPRARRIAIANPRHAPYGQAAVAALQTDDLYEQIADRLVLGENIAQTAQFVQSGAADIGIIALALALAPRMSEAGRFWEIPLERFPEMVQGGVIVRHAKNPEGAEALRAFLLSAEGQRVLQDFGFLMPEALP